MNKQALVIGASGGIGAAIAKELHLDGFHVIMAARNEKKLVETADCLKITSRTIMPVDLSDRSSIENLFERLGEHTEPVHYIVIAAGGWQANTINDSLTELEAGLQTMLARNCIGPALAMKAGADYLKQVGGGRLINISSHAATKQLPDNLAYGPAKAAIRQFALSLDNDTGPEVDVTDIQPAVVNTESMTAQLGDNAAQAIQPTAIGKLVVSLANLDRSTKVKEIALDAEYTF